MTITFTNPGEIDQLAFSVMGLSAKETSSPIGQFGTGLKYSIAIALRLGGSITIWSGLTRYDFQAEPSLFRGKTILKATYTTNEQASLPLPFTLDYGKAWEPWQVIRELESNARDEGGRSAPGRTPPQAGTTTIWLEGEPFEAAYKQLNSIFVRPQTLRAGDTNLTGYAHIHQRDEAYGNRIYYRGVAVGDVKRQPLFTYDFHYELALSEDRNIQYYYISAIPRLIADTTMVCTNPSVVEAILTARSDSLEGSLVFPEGDPYYATSASRKTFYSIISSYVESNRANLLNVSALRNYYQTFEKEDSLYEPYTPTSREKAMLVEAQLLVANLFEGKLAPFKLTTSLPNNALGMVYADRIYISKECFSQGLETLTGTIFEEYCHYYLKHEDETRTFQNHLINTISKLLAELHFEKNGK